MWKTVLPKENSNFSREVFGVLSDASPQDIARYLDSQLFTSPRLLDLYDWRDVLNRIAELLEDCCLYIANVRDLSSPLKHDNMSEQVSLAKSLLQFLIRLIVAAKDKRHFTAFQVIDKLLSSFDLEITKLCLELLFNICIPASSISANSNDDWMDAIEVPLFIANAANIIFQNLCFNSTDLGLVNFINGQVESFVDPVEFTTTISMSENKSIMLSPLDEAASPQDFVAFVEEHAIDSDNVWSIFLMRRALHGYRQKALIAEDFIHLRLYSFFVLIHSKVPATELEKHVGIGCSFLNDIVALSDVNHESLSALKLKNPVLLAHLCLENVLGLLESKLKRRSSVFVKSHIFEMLDLERQADLGTEGYDERWMTIVTSSILFSKSLTSIPQIVNVDDYYYNIGRFARLGLELYAVTLTTRDPMHVFVDIRMVAVIIGYIKSLVEDFPRVLEQCETQIPHKYDRFTQTLHVITKALYCLELTADHAGYLTALLECDGINLVSSIVDAYSSVLVVPGKLQMLFDKCISIRNILESTLSVLQISLRRYRHTGGVQLNIANSGHRVAYSKSFLELGKELFQDISSNSDVVWYQYVLVLKETVDMDPAFLSTFLKNEVSLSMQYAFVHQLPFVRDSRESKLDIERLYLPLARFLLSVGITTEGRDFIDRSGILEFILQGLQNDMSILPNSCGLGADKVVKIGKIFAELIHSHQKSKDTIVVMIRDSVKSLCAAAIALSDSSADWLTKRSPGLQKLSNYCLLIESMFSENRRQFQDAIKTVFEGNIVPLLQVFPATLPSDDQFAAQITIPNQQSYPLYGYSFCAKMVSNAVRLAASIMQEQVITSIFHQLNEELIIFGVAKQELLALSHGEVPLAQNTSKSDEVDVNVYGLLSHVPHDTVISDYWVSARVDHRKVFLRVVKSILHLEWLCAFVAHTFRTLTRTSSSSFLTTARDTLRRLFALFKSSISEISRHSSSSWTSKEFRESQPTKGLLDGFGSYDIHEIRIDSSDRIPASYQLNVIGMDGALVRQEVEIDNSRIIFVAEVGTILQATARRSNSGNLIRYQLDMGWISEYRRDMNRSPLLEVISVSGKDLLPIDKGTVNRMGCLLTLREAMCLNITRLQATLRQVTIGVARLGSISGPLNMTVSSGPNPLVGFVGNIVQQLTKDVEDLDLKNIDDCATKMLALGAMAKNVLLPALEDKNGNFNVNLLRFLMTSKTTSSLGKAFVLSCKLLSVEILSGRVQTPRVLSALGQAALSCVSSMLLGFRKLANRQTLMSSIGDGFLIDNESYQVEDIVASFIAPLSESISLVIANPDIAVHVFPWDMQESLLSFILELVKPVDRPPLPFGRSTQRSHRREISFHGGPDINELSSSLADGANLGLPDLVADLNDMELLQTTNSPQSSSVPVKVSLSDCLSTFQQGLQSNFSMYLGRMVLEFHHAFEWNDRNTNFAVIQRLFELLSKLNKVGSNWVWKSMIVELLKCLKLFSLGALDESNAANVLLLLSATLNGEVLESSDLDSVVESLTSLLGTIQRWIPASGEVQVNFPGWIGATLLASMVVMRNKDNNDRNSKDARRRTDILTESIDDHRVGDLKIFSVESSSSGGIRRLTVDVVLSLLNRENIIYSRSYDALPLFQVIAFLLRPLDGSNAVLDGDVLKKILSLQSNLRETTEDSDILSNVFCEITFRCLNSSAERRESIWMSIVQLFDKLSVSEKHLSLAQFLKGLSTFIIEDPVSFYSVCRDGLNFEKSKERETLGGISNEIRVTLKSSGFSVGNTIVDDDSDILIAEMTSLLLQQVEECCMVDVNNSPPQSSRLFNGIDCLRAMADSMLRLHRFPKIVMTVLATRPLVLTRLLDRVCLLPTDDINGSTSLRFLLAFSMTKGSARNTVLDSIVARFRAYLAESGDIYNMKIQRLCQLLLLIIRGKPAVSHSRRHGVSLDVVDQLCRRTGFLGSLIDGMLQSPELLMAVKNKSALLLLELLELLSNSNVLGMLEHRTGRSAASLTPPPLLSHIDTEPEVYHEYGAETTTGISSEMQHHEDEDRSLNGNSDVENSEVGFTEPVFGALANLEQSTDENNADDDYVNLENSNDQPARNADQPREEFDVADPTAGSLATVDYVRAPNGEDLRNLLHRLQGAPHNEAVEQLLRTLIPPDTSRAAFPQTRPNDPYQLCSFETLHPLFNIGVEVHPSGQALRTPYQLPSQIGHDTDDILLMPAVWPQDQRFLRNENELDTELSHRRPSRSYDSRDNNNRHMMESSTILEAMHTVIARDFVVSNPIGDSSTASQSASVVLDTRLEDGIPENESISVLEDGSQSTMTFVSRPAPSILSQIALQDPNPRQSGEDFSVTGGPIPPLIEIESPDVEANEDMSVLTGPHDNESQVPIASAVEEDLSIVEEENNASSDQESAGLEGQSMSSASLTMGTMGMNDLNNDVDERIDESEDISVLTLPHVDCRREAIELHADSNAGEDHHDEDHRSSTPLVEDTGNGDDSSSAENDDSSSSSSAAESEEINGSIHNDVVSEIHFPEESIANAAITTCPPGYDPDVFNLLPPEMQLEILEQHNETNENIRSLAEAAGFDFETLMSLPDDIRQEVLDQARRQQGGAANPSNAAIEPTDQAAIPAAVDNVAFLASLPPDLRAEVLLTAEDDFLSTLPESIVAEAQSVRERAATQWQTRELLARRMADQIPVESHGQANADSLMSQLRHDRSDEDSYYDSDAEEDEEEEDDIDEDDVEEDDNDNALAFGAHDEPIAVNAHFSGFQRRRAITGGSLRAGHSEQAKSTSDGSPAGIMRIPKDLSLQFNVPKTALAACVKYLVSPFKQPSKFVDLLMKVISHCCVLQESKDLCMRLMCGLIAQNDSLVSTSLTNFMAPGEAVETIESCLFANQAESTKLTPICAQSKKGMATSLNKVAFFRIVYVMSQLSASNAGMLFAMLQPRTASFAVTDSARGESSRSLLETILLKMGLFLQGNRVKELESLMKLLEQVTKPLASISVNGVKNADWKETADSKYLAVEVPEVRVSRSALSSLCEILLSDLSTDKTFTLATTSIARLAHVKANSFILRDLLHDVLVDISTQTAYSLTMLSNFLMQHELQSSSADQRGARKLPELLPWGEVGYERLNKFHRLIKTTTSMMQSESTLSVDGLEDVWLALDGVMNLSQAFFAEEDANQQNPANGSLSRITSSPQQTAVLSLLRRLQPVIESFLTLHLLDMQSMELSVRHASSVSGAPNEVLTNHVPGHHFRVGDSYHLANLSLLTQSADGSDVPVGPTLRRHISLTSMSSMTRASSMLSNKSLRLLSFVQSHRAAINLLIKQRPLLLIDGSLSPLIRITQLRSCISFENKRTYFYHHLKKLQRPQGQRSISIQIRRTQVFEDSFHQLRARRPDELRGRLQVNFYGEEGIDAGGLSREWYTILAREIFNPNYALFMATADGATFQPNPLSIINSNHLDYFKFVGRLIAKAVCDGQLMDAHFTRSFYKHVLGLPVDFADIEATEPDYYKSLKLMLEHPLESMGFTGMTFTAEIQKFGRVEDVELIPNGNKVAVTDENKHEYIRLVAQHRMTTAISSQIEAFLGGFYDLIPPELICIFAPVELELLICGLPDVNVDDLQQNTEYNQYRPTDDTIVWFWQALRSFNREERAAFLQFITGTSKVPLGGFSHLQGMRGNQKFSIHKAFGGESGKLPSAHTCYNQLDLPSYSSAEELRDKLLFAIQEGSEGFGFA